MNEGKKMNLFHGWWWVVLRVGRLPVQHDESWLGRRKNHQSSFVALNVLHQVIVHSRTTNNNRSLMRWIGNDMAKPSKTDNTTDTTQALLFVVALSSMHRRNCFDWVHTIVLFVCWIAFLDHNRNVSDKRQAKKYIIHTHDTHDTMNLHTTEHRQW